MKLKSVTVVLRGVTSDGFKTMSSLTVTCTPQEAFTLLTMPCLSGQVVEMTPEYELSPVSESENEE